MFPFETGAGEWQTANVYHLTTIFCFTQKEVAHMQHLMWPLGLTWWNSSETNFLLMVKRQICSGDMAKHNPLYKIENFYNYVVDVIFVLGDYNKGHSKSLWGSKNLGNKLFFHSDISKSGFHYFWLTKWYINQFITTVIFLFLFSNRFPIQSKNPPTIVYVLLTDAALWVHGKSTLIS